MSPSAEVQRTARAEYVAQDLNRRMEAYNARHPFWRRRVTRDDVLAAVIVAEALHPDPPPTEGQQ